MNQALFITGTDTDVGKTYATALLARSFQQLNRSVGVMKPVQTGCEEDRAPDLDAVYQALGTPPPRPYDQHVPYRYSTPCSPHLAAELHQRPIDPTQLLKAVAHMKPHFDPLLIEGAGGLFVPLTRSYQMIDFIQNLRIPVVLVCRSNLGTLNHTQLSVQALHQRGIPLAGFILNHHTPEPPGMIETDNQKTLCDYIDAPLIAHIKYQSPGAAEIPQSMIAWATDF